MTSIYPSDPSPDRVTKNSNPAKNTTETIKAATSSIIRCIKVKNTYRDICFTVCTSDTRGVIIKMKLLPKKIFFTTGAGTHRESLESFEMALRDAGIEKFNLVSVSSILPPNCEIIAKDEGLRDLLPGEIVFCVMSRNTSNEPNRIVSASLGCAVPQKNNEFGYISEHHAFGETTEHAGAYAERLASSMYETWTDSKPRETFNISTSATVGEQGLWTTVLSVAVMVL